MTGRRHMMLFAVLTAMQVSNGGCSAWFVGVLHAPVYLLATAL